MRARPAGRSRKKETAQSASFDLILLAAGAGSRFGAPDKLFRPVGGKSLLLHALEFWSTLPQISTIVIAIPPTGMRDRRLRDLLKAGNERALLVEGGLTRQQSVFNALNKVTSSNVVIHDGARPTLYREDVTALIKALTEYEAVTLGTPVINTLVRVSGRTPPEGISRTGIWQVYTPQGFRTQVIREAHEWARETGAQFTDDFTLACMVTDKAHIVETHKFYLKMTYPEDEKIWRALAILPE